jgi:site-specific DNA recombinase
LARRTTKARIQKAVISPLDEVRVGIYRRRSTDDENQPYTIEAQGVSLHAYVQSQERWRIVKDWVDDASGATTERDGLKQAMRAVKAGLIDVLLVYRVDRFSRNLRDTVTLLDELDKHNVVFRSATEPFDTATAIGRMLVQMLGMFAQFERDLIVDRVTNGHNRKAAKGKWSGGRRPYGYLKEKVTHFLVPNPAEEGTVKLIFDLYTKDRLGASSIATILNERGYRTSGGKLWSTEPVLRVLTNRVYIGEIVYGEVVVKDCHPKLIEMHQFDEAQRILATRSRSHGHRAANSSDYIATGRLNCPTCGAPMIGTRANGRNRTYRYYTCWTRNKYGTKVCNEPRIDADALDQAVVDVIASFYRSQQALIERAVAIAQNACENGREALEAEAKVIEAKITSTNGKIDKYLDAFEDGKLEPDDVKTRLSKLKEQLQQLRDRRHQLADELATTPVAPGSATLADVNDNIKDVLTTGTNNQLKALVESVVTKIKILGPGRLLPVLRVPQPVGEQLDEPGDAESASVRALSQVVPPIGLEPTL